MASKPLAQDLQFEKKNQDMVKLPNCQHLPIFFSQSPCAQKLIRLDARVQKRPIPHAPVASPYAGSSVPKIVYVSTKTPFMSAVKRVQKLLRQAEKRAMASLDLSSKRKTEKEKLAQLAQGHDQLRKGKGEEEVFIKATGRAMDKALSVGKWFETRETEYIVRVKTGSVLVVDDVVEDEEARQKVVAEGEKAQQEESKDEVALQSSDKSVSKSAAKKRKRAANAEAKELPESRTRWVNVVEVAVTYK